MNLDGREIGNGTERFEIGQKEEREENEDLGIEQKEGAEGMEGEVEGDGGQSNIGEGEFM